MIEKIKASLLGVAIGDALGMPVETMTRAQIKARYPKGINTFMAPVQQRIGSTAVLTAGSTTDDWFLTRVVAESLIARQTFDLNDMAKRHIAALQAKVDLGKNATKAIESLRDGRPINHPPLTDPNQGAGCGVAMKIAPLACFAAASKKPVDPKTLSLWVWKLAGLTHTEPQAWEAAYALATLIEQVLTHPYSNWKEAQERLDLVCERLANSTAEKGPDTVQGRLRRGRDHLDDREWITREITPGWLAKQSVVYAILMALSHGRMFAMGVTRAVNDGMDTDSTAAMVGAIMGANGGLEPIPERWKTFGPSMGEALSVGEALYESARQD